MTAAPRLAYKVLTAPQMAQFKADGTFAGAPVDLADGYIHLSTGAQVTETVDKHFAGQADLYVVALDLSALGATVRWEPSRGGQLFPHVYADLPLSAAIAWQVIERDSGGAVILPSAA